MYTWMNKSAFPCEARKIGLAVAVLLALTGGATAQPRYHMRVDQFYSIYPSPNQSGAPSRWDRARFDRSGTRGRQGLGANPVRPEGPGNVSD